MPYRIKNVFLIITLLVLNCTIAKAQGFDAAFEANVNSGCSPLLVTFTDTSNTQGITSRTWILGNGNTSTGNNATVSATYNNTGLYTVTLIISDGFQSDTASYYQYIEVYDDPSPLFTIAPPTQGCAPLAVQFTNNSSSNGPPIVNYSWDFGDGTPVSNAQTPNHTYLYSGSFQVQLTATDANGCSGSFIYPASVQVDPQPVASFSADSVSACNPPLTVTFSNNSTGTPPLSYTWNYALGTTTNNTPPTTTYSNAGGYDVSLQVTDGNGCTDTLDVDNFIAIGNVSADFDIPDTVCPGEVFQINNTSFGGVSFNWDFGDGTTSTLQSPSKSYSSPGTYTISLTSHVSSGCSDNVLKTIVVENFQISPSADQNYSCEAPFTVNFTSTSTTAATNWNWYFEGYDTLYNTSSNQTITYTQPGEFNVLVEATSSNGCPASYSQSNMIRIIGLQDTNIMADPISGCVPLTVDFLDQSQPYDSIMSYLWEFDNGTSSTYQSTQFTYNDTGIYFVTATLTLYGGCEIEEIIEISVGDHQQPNFLIDTVIACSSDSFSFTNLSTDQNYIDAYEWTFIGPNSTAVSVDFEPKQRIKDTGWVEVRLATDHNGCLDTLSVDSQMYVLGPYARFSSSVNCDSIFWRELYNTSMDYTSFFWDFGDGSPIDAINDTILHDYIQRGNYKTKLVTYNSNTGCEDSVTVTMAIREPIACFTINDSTPCRYQDVFYQGQCSQDAVNYNWNDGEGDFISLPKNYWSEPYQSDGVFTPSLIVYDQNGCADTAYKTLKVYKPEARFSADSDRACVNDIVHFFDQTLYDTTSSTWQWDLQGLNYYYTENPTHSYLNTGYQYYDVELIVTDVLGCSDTLYAEDTILVGAPNPIFTISDLTLCVGDELQFGTIPNWNHQYVWDFGNGDTSYTQFPSYQYPAYGNYDVTLTVYDSIGCDSSFTYPVSVNVEGISGVGIIADPTDTNCYPVNVQVMDTSGLTYINSWEWDFGDGTTLTTGAPVAYHTYNLSGSFPVVLTVTTGNGCIDSVVVPDLINITGPFAKLKTVEDVYCLGDTITFYADSARYVDEFVFDFGDGMIIQQADSTVKYAYNQTGYVSVFMLMSGENNTCIKSDSISFFVGHVETEMVTSDTIGCVPLTVDFSEISLGENLYAWESNIAYLSSDSALSYTFDQAGTYFVTLTARNDSTWCDDQDSVTVIVQPLPNIQANDDDILCIGSEYQLQASGGEFYVWSPLDYLDNIYSPNPVTNTIEPITYTVSGTDSNGCVNTDQVYIDIQPEPVLSFISEDTVAFPGMTIPIYSDSDMDLTYSWSPSSSLTCTTCPNPTATPEETTTYTLSYSDQLGCFTFDTTFTIIIDDEYSIFIPNAFTPDGDGINDEFMVKAYGFKKFESFAIYDRWGDLIFETADLDEGWDGTYPNGDKAQSQQVYVYRFIAERYNGEQFEKKGSVLLLRN